MRMQHKSTQTPDVILLVISVMQTAVPPYIGSQVHVPKDTLVSLAVCNATV